jgi:hypothetical protein
MCLVCTCAHVMHYDVIAILIPGIPVYSILYLDFPIGQYTVIGNTITHRLSEDLWTQVHVLMPKKISVT